MVLSQYLNLGGISVRQRLATLITGLSLAASLLVGCGPETASFCEAARDVEAAVRELDVDEVATALDEEFWSSLLKSMDDLIASESGEMKAELESLRSELSQFIDQLEAVDYNLLAAALDPETATSYLAVAAALVLFVADTLQSEIETNC